MSSNHEYPYPNLTQPPVEAKTILEIRKSTMPSTEGKPNFFSRAMSKLFRRDVSRDTQEISTINEDVVTRILGTSLDRIQSINDYLEVSLIIESPSTYLTDEQKAQLTDDQQKIAYDRITTEATKQKIRLAQALEDTIRVGNKEAQQLGIDTATTLASLGEVVGLSIDKTTEPEFFDITERIYRRLVHANTLNVHENLLHGMAQSLAKDFLRKFALLDKRKK